MPWTVYILQCADGTFYTGITTNVKRRFAEHARGVGAKYTRGRGPHALVYTEGCSTQSRALKREAEIKSLRLQKKRQLIEGV